MKLIYKFTLSDFNKLFCCCQNYNCYFCDMDYSKIIGEILEVYKLNATELAEKIDVQRSSISHILSGRNKPSLDFLIKIKTHFAELRWDYLMFGNRPMTESEEKSIQDSRKERASNENDIVEKVGATPLLHADRRLEQQKNQEFLEKDINTSPSRKVVKVVWFYNDNTFEVFEN